MRIAWTEERKARLSLFLSCRARYSLKRQTEEASACHVLHRIRQMKEEYTHSDLSPCHDISNHIQVLLLFVLFLMIPIRSGYLGAICSRSRRVAIHTSWCWGFHSSHHVLDCMNALNLSRACMAGQCQRKGKKAKVTSQAQRRVNNTMQEKTPPSLSLQRDQQRPSEHLVHYTRQRHCSESARSTVH